MKTFFTWNLSLKLLFVALLFTFFVWRFAIPSFKKFLYSGVTIDKTWARRQQEDSPSVTFCALNNKAMLGWKRNESINEEDWFTSAIVVFCNNPKTVDDAMDCLDKETFNLTETIKTIKTTAGNNIKTNNEVWMQDISETYQGRVF